MNERNGRITEQVLARTARAVKLAIPALLLAVVVASCGGGGSSPAATPAVTPTITLVPPTATEIPPAAVGEIFWTSAVDPETNAPVDAVTSFRTTAQAIYAVVRVSNLPGGTVVSSEWSYNGVPLEGANNGVVPPSDYAAGFVQFHLAKAEDREWPAGTYSLNVLLNGDAVQLSQIEVLAS